MYTTNFTQMSITKAGFAELTRRKIQAESALGKHISWTDFMIVSTKMWATEKVSK